MSERTKVVKYSKEGIYEAEEEIAIESPLKLILRDDEKEKVVYIMRTPGDDKELSLGFLFTQGIITSIDDVESIQVYDNETVIRLRKPIKFDRELAIVNSSCGICGNSSLIKIFSQGKRTKVRASVLLSLPYKMRKTQKLFLETGGLHAAALFDLEGNLLSIKEDVGRHNAVDKVIGEMLSKGYIGVKKESDREESHILQVSGRAGYEIVEKAITASITVISAISAPTTSAIELCKITGVTLVGFNREDKFNVYAHPERIEF